MYAVLCVLYPGVAMHRSRGLRQSRPKPVACMLRTDLRQATGPNHPLMEDTGHVAAVIRYLAE